MKEIPLTQGKVAIVDDADYEALSKWKWHLTHYGYAARRDGVTDEMFYMHRVLLGLARHEKTMVDHVNLDRLDNRRENIRRCDKTTNSINRLPQKNNTSGFKGVSHGRYGGWRARTKIKGKEVHLGTYETSIEAAAAYDRAVRSMHGDYARTNLQGATA